MTLRTKTSLLLAGLIIFIFAGGGFLALRFLEASLKKTIFDGLKGISTSSSESISRFLNHTLEDAERIASALPKKALEEKNVSVIEEHLKTVVKTYPKFENGVFLLDAQGNLWADYPAYPEIRGKNFAFREYFKTTMEKQNGIIGIPYRSARTGEAVLTFTGLLRGPNHQVLGLIGCSVQLLHPDALGGIRRTKIGESGYIYVYDTSRLMILHPEDKRVLQRDVLPGANKLFDAGIEGFEGVGETVNSRGVPMLLSIKQIPGTNWIIGAQQPKSEAFAPIKKGRIRIIVWAFLAVLISTMLSTVAVRRLTEPLAKLRKVAMEMGQVKTIRGDAFQSQQKNLQDELKTIHSSDEIGDLAKAFNLMHTKLNEAFASLNETIKTLQENEERYRTLAEAAQDMIFIIDRNGMIQYVNEFAAKKHRSSPGQIIGKSQKSFFPPEVSERHQSNLQKIFETGRPLYIESSTPFPERLMHLGTWLAPIKGESGEVRAVLGISRDITERKRMEEALQVSEEKYRSVVANANDAIFIAQDGMIKFPNPSALSITGYSEEEYAGIRIADLIHPEDREMVLNRHQRRLMGEETPSPYSFRILNKAGEELWVQLNAVRIEWEGKPGILCFLRDITQQKKLEAQFQQAQKMEAVGTLAGGIAHDFNNLLQTVLGYTEILFHEDAGKSISQELLHIKHAAQRGAELTQQILTFSRKVQSKLRPVDLNIEVKQVQKLLQRTIPKMIDVELHLADDLKVISADPAQVEQILMNLSVNARDAMPEGGKLIIGTNNIFLDESYCRGNLEAHPGEHVLLSVSDTGHGMDKETIEHIFEPFYTTKGVGKGTGLGLAMVYGIVKSHGGHIQCLSQPGKGTIFSVYFPVFETETMAEDSTEEKIPVGGKETVLLVDDETSIRELGERTLLMSGYTVLKASDGERALEIYRREHEKIDLVILDLIMPGMGGKKCLEKILEMNPNAKVVIASGYTHDLTSDNPIEKRAKAIVLKPFNISQLLQVIRKVLDE
jgi:PAS domain S-box-containing protein